MANPVQDTPVWLITGCSTELGRALGQLIVDRGWRLAHIEQVRGLSIEADYPKG